MGCHWKAGSGVEESRRAAAATFKSASVEKLERFVWRNDLHRSIRLVPWSFHCCFHASLGVAVQDSKSGAAAAGGAALRMEVVCGAGGARYLGPTGPDPGGGERFT